MVESPPSQTSQASVEQKFLSRSLTTNGTGFRKTLSCLKQNRKFANYFLKDPRKNPRKRVEQVHIRKLWFYYDIYSVSSPLSSVSSPV